MAVLETMTFRLVDGADLAAFRAADERLQAGFAYQQAGLLRRTTARGDGDRCEEWMVLDLWDSAESAEACAALWDGDPLAQEFMAFVDRGTVDVRRYATV